MGCLAQLGGHSAPFTLCRLVWRWPQFRVTHSGTVGETTDTEGQCLGGFGHGRLLELSQRIFSGGLGGMWRDAEDYSPGGGKKQTEKTKQMTPQSQGCFVPLAQPGQGQKLLETLSNEKREVNPSEVRGCAFSACSCRGENR